MTIINIFIEEKGKKKHHSTKEMEYDYVSHWLHDSDSDVAFANKNIF